MKFNEDSRVKLPGLLHFLRLGYKYQTKKGQNIDSRNNIFVDIFREDIRKINSKDFSDEQLDGIIKEVTNLIDNKRDKGDSFFDRLTVYNDIKLIDLKEPENNDFRIVAELTFKGERDEFRPDITVLVNGIPLGFIEVKKPNNQNGIQAEFQRMKERLANEDFTHFFNQLQVLGFTNNQLYDDTTRIKLQGSFYATPNGKLISYNHFREEREIPVCEFIDDNEIDYILSDNNITSIRTDAEFITNLKPDTPANKFITSVFSKERFIFFIRYGIVYVDSQVDGLNKHIIRYPQYFALTNLVEKIDKGMTRGILWHTQGSGKTAFSYFATNVLRVHYQQKKVITKFYFVVDRLDLLIQATDEFTARGMSIATINSKADFKDNIQSPVVIDNASQRGKYKETMNVVNIQKFDEDSTVLPTEDTKVQRIYFLDEVHRGYKPKGTFLANLLGADPHGIYIGLTGTPILASEDGDGNSKGRPKRKFKSTDLFSEYIHKYYYNKSIADGYTLKIKKENIATEFKNDIRKMLSIPEGKPIPAKRWEELTKKSAYIRKLCKYIIDDFGTFKDVQNDQSLGCMVVTASSGQAKLIQEWFEQNSQLKTALVLYDEEDNKDKQEYFRGKRDQSTGEVVIKYSGVIVYNMLLTGFDAPRLKRLYLLRTIREHSLLQTLARVNRPYKKMKYGYIVDFVDITEEYEETNRRYLEELRADIADKDDQADVTDMFVDVEEVKKKITNLENSLFIYIGNIENNLELFRQQIEPLDEKTLRDINSQLVEYRECYNELRMSHVDVRNIPIDRLNKAYYEVSRRIDLKVAERILNDDNYDDSDVDFTQLIVEFLKTGEIDLEFTTENDIMEIITKINNAFSANTDQEDPAYIDIFKRYRQLIRNFKNDCDTTSKVKHFIVSMNLLYKEILTLNGNNNSLTNRYHGDEDCMRIHKRILQDYSSIMNDIKTYEFMTDIINSIDTLLGHMAKPTQNIVMRELLNPVRVALKKQGFKDVSKRQCELIIYLFIDDKFKRD